MRMGERPPSPGTGSSWKSLAYPEGNRLTYGRDLPAERRIGDLDFQARIQPVPPVSRTFTFPDSSARRLHVRGSENLQQADFATELQPDPGAFGFVTPWLRRISLMIRRMAAC